MIAEAKVVDLCALCEYGTIVVAKIFTEQSAATGLLLSFTPLPLLSAVWFHIYCYDYLGTRAKRDLGGSVLQEKHSLF
jgi:hypothetical protein